MIGISPENFRINASDCNQTLQYAVSSCFMDIPPEQVTNILVTAIARSSAMLVLFRGNNGAQGTTLLRGAALTMGASNTSHVSYVVTSYNPDDTYDHMRATIDGALTRGELTEQLQYWARQFNVPDLFNVTLTSPNTTQVAGPDTGDAAGNLSKLSAAAIVGIALGGFFWLLMLYALYRFVVHVENNDRSYHYY
jgi:hypothetical protein